MGLMPSRCVRFWADGMAYRGALLAYSLVFLCALSVVGDADVSTPVRSSFLEDPGYFETEDSIIVEGSDSESAAY
ncbi:hypothetical protein M8J77_018067 [Diaphorina citri]|nr:hypothetical protein M8J77_018067 [Diaphorina citri]